MSSSPVRCTHNRVHRDLADLGRYNTCQVPEIDLSTPLPDAKKKGAGRSNQRSSIPTSSPSPTTPTRRNLDDSTGWLSSPLTFIPGVLQSLPTPEASQQEPSSMPPDDTVMSRPVDEVQHTPEGTSFVPGTPIIGVPVQEFDDSAIQQQNSPSPGQANFADNGALANHDVLQCKMEINHLRRSRDRALGNLKESNALTSRLQTRRQIHEAQAAHTNALLDESRNAASQAERRAQWAKRWLGSSVAVLVLLIVLYAIWCCYNAEDMAYIRQRRTAMLEDGYESAYQSVWNAARKARE